MSTTVWMLNTIGLLATTIAALVVFLHLHRTSKPAESLPAECAPLLKDRRMLTTTMGLMALWFVIQYVAVLFTS
jgi:hypothetical protein